MFFDFRNRCLQSEFVINKYVDKLQSVATVDKFTLTKLKVVVLQNFGTSYKNLDNVKTPGKDLKGGVNHKNANTGDVNLQFPQISSMSDNLQNSIFSEDEDDIFFEEEEDEYETPQTQNNTKLLHDNVNTIVEDNQEDKIQLDAFGSLNNLCGVQTSIMERVKLQKRHVKTCTQENKPPASKHILSKSNESFKTGTTDIKDEINDVKQLELQNYKNNTFIYSVDEGSVHAPNLGDKLINLNDELNQLKCNLLSYLKDNLLGSQCLSKMNLVIDSVICNFKDKLRHNFEHDEVEGLNLNMLETPERIISKYRDINKLENATQNNYYKNTIPKEINLEESQDMFLNEPKTFTLVGNISAFNSNENVVNPHLHKRQTSVDIEDSLATHVVFNKNLVNVTPPKTTSRRTKRKFPKVRPIKLTRDQSLKYSVYRTPRSKRIPHRCQSSSPILKSLLVSSDDVIVVDDSPYNSVPVDPEEALADHDYTNTTIVEDDINLRSILKTNVKYYNESCIPTRPLSTGLNYQNETSLMTSLRYYPSTSNFLPSSTALNNQDAMSLISLKHDSSTNAYNNIQKTPVEDFPLFEEHDMMVDKSTIIIENVDVLQDLNVPFQNSNEYDNLYLHQNCEEEQYPRTNTNPVIMGARKKNSRLQEIVESAKYKIRKKRSNFIYDDPLNILKTWTKRRRNTTKRNKQRKSCECSTIFIRL